MAAVLAEARRRGLSHVTVHSGRRAVDFYVRNGFRHHRRLRLWEPEGSGRRAGGADGLEWQPAELWRQSWSAGPYF
jgi:hypothetical protein